MKNFFETKKQQKDRLVQYSPEMIQLSAASDVIGMLPQEGRIDTIRGGIGNGILKQVTKKNGVLFERKSIDDEWSEMDAEAFYNRVLNSFSPVLNSKPKKKWYEFWK